MCDQTVITIYKNLTDGGEMEDILEEAGVKSVSIYPSTYRVCLLWDISAQFYLLCPFKMPSEKVTEEEV